MKFEVLTENMVKLEEKVNELNRKSEKLGTDPITFKLIREFTRKVSGRHIFYSEIEVEGCVPKVGNYSLIAAIEILDDGQALIKTVPGETCPEKYRTTTTYCDHCGINRYRKDVFVIKDGDNYLQVGRTCLKDFCGPDMEQIIRRFEVLYETMMAAGESEFCGRQEKVVSPEQYLKHVALCVRKVGYVKTDGNFPTKQLALESLFFHALDPKVKRELEKAGVVDVEPQDEAKAAKVMEWLKNLEPGSSDYLYNLKALAVQKYVDDKKLGYLASAVTAYNRAMEIEEKKKEAAKAGAKSEYVGTEKKRQSFENVTCKMARTIETYYGPSTMFRFVDPNGNILIWFASGYVETFTEGETYNIVGTVKKHELYKGTKQTQINRVKVDALAGLK